MTPETIFKLANDVYSPFAMLAGMKLDVHTPLANGSLAAAEIARAIAVKDVDRLEVLLYALVRAGLLTVSDGNFANTAEADAFLVRGRPGYMGTNHSLYSDIWSSAMLKLADSIQAGEALGKHDFANMSDEALGGFLRGLHAGAVATGRQLAAEYQLDQASTLVDVGGGSGGLAIGACQACPNLQAMVVDLVRVEPFARDSITQAGLSDRVNTIAADVTSEVPSCQADIAVLRFFIQVLGRQAAATALKNVAAVLPSGGRLIIVGHILDASRLAPPAASGQSLVMAAIYDEGQAYSEAEYRSWLSAAGFSDPDIRYGAAAAGSSIMTARKR